MHDTLVPDRSDLIHSTRSDRRDVTWCAPYEPFSDAVVPARAPRRYPFGTHFAPDTLTATRLEWPISSISWGF